LPVEQQESGDDKSDTDFEGNVIMQDIKDRLHLLPEGISHQEQHAKNL
jgi:hypothetical protein